MKWYFKVMGGHTHVRVYVPGKANDGALCGDLCFRNEEFEWIKRATLKLDTGDRAIVFIEEATKP